MGYIGTSLKWMIDCVEEGGVKQHIHGICVKGWWKIERKGRKAEQMEVHTYIAGS